MKRNRLFLNLIVLISLILVQLVPSALAKEPVAPLKASLAALEGWTGDIRISVRNQASGLLPTGYTVTYTLDTSGLTLLSNCNDLRITYVNETTETELDRLVEGCKTTTTKVSFRTQAAIAVGGLDSSYHLYYNNPAAGSPPASPTNVYAFYDDFEDANADGWTIGDGTWGVVADGGSDIYRYTGGGTGWAISYVPMVGVADLEMVSQVRAAASTSWIGLAYRIQDTANFRTFYESKDVGLFKYAQINGDNHTILGLTPGFVMAPDVWYSIRLQAIGNQVRARIWQNGTSEPITWTIEYIDATFQDQTNIGVTLPVHATTADWDNFQVRKLVDVEPLVEVYTPPTPPTPITEWFYRAPVTVTNTSATATLPVRYTVVFTLNTAELIASGKMLATCQDLQIGSLVGSVVYAIDRVVENCNTTATRVWFALQRPVLPSASDAGYYVLYGDLLTPPTPMAEEMNVFLFFEDWEQTTAHWTNAGGLDPVNTGKMGLSVISAEAAISPSNSQKFPTKVGGGDAFSGFIPVTPNTTYAIATWAKAGENTYAPVGFDPYTADFAQGTEVWLWTNEWTIGPVWAWRSAQFTTSADTAFIKIKSEWWLEAGGNQPVYMDNLGLRYAIASEPTLTLGNEATTLPVPVISNIIDNGPVNLGSSVTISAQVSKNTADPGVINAVTLRLVSPVSLDVPMSLLSGSSTDGVWRTSYTPTQGGVFSYRILAHSSSGYQTLSPVQTFTVSDTAPPVISNPSFTNPILVRNIQTVSVQVTDNGVISSVNLTVGGAPHPMILSGGVYSYSWEVTTVGDIPFTITATDSAGNLASLSSSFTSQAREVDICTWKGCKAGAESWSIDDGNTSCRTNLETAGFRGTYYYNGTETLDWFSLYAAAGHEIAAHTVGHVCTPPSCSPNCTPETWAAIPYTQAEVDAYRLGQLEPNIAAIEAGIGKPVMSLAWSCGCVDPGRMAAASYYFLGARGYYDYIAELTWVEDVNKIVPDYFYNLNSGHAYNQTLIDRAVTEGKWAIITSHGDCSGIDYMGTRKDVLWAAPVGEVLEYISIRQNAVLSNYSRVSDTISFDAAHTLLPKQRQKVDGTFFAPIPFDDPVSLKVHILDTDTVVSVFVAGVEVSYTVKTIDGARYVVFDTPLNITSRHIVVNLGSPAPTIVSVTENSVVELGTPAQVTAVVTIPEGTISNVTLRVLSPVAADYAMVPVEGSPNNYRASFTPGSLGIVTYQVLATNNTGGSSQSTVRNLTVRDTIAPARLNQSQTNDTIGVGQANLLTADGLDIGGLEWATLETNETGVWQAFTWPVSDWWDHEWSKRVPLTLAETAGLARSAETIDVLVTATAFPGLTNCAAELRVADADGNELPSQVYGETGSGDTLSCHLLFQASLGASASRTYYVYYANPAATPPSYTTDLTSTPGAGMLMIQNSFFNLDLDVDGGVISRLRLPQGSNTNLPLSPESDSYWGLHQICSSLDGNISGKNNLCVGGAAPATGLSLATTLDGPILKEFTLTSVKGSTTYTIVYRFFANAAHYQYQLARVGSTASVMNNFWYTNGNFPRLGSGTGGTPATTYNLYDNTSDQMRIASFTTVNVASIDGQNNDGTDLGGTDYMVPTSPGLELWVTTGVSQAATETELGRLAAPVEATMGIIEDAPATQYGSPANLNGVVTTTSASFVWQNPAIPVDTLVSWRVRFCDISGNCGTTGEMTFRVVEPTAVTVPTFTGQRQGNAIQLAWETANELDLIGFILHRSQGNASERESLLESPILALSPGSLEGNTYQYLDAEIEPGVLYTYWLEVITHSGTTLIGPVSAGGYTIFIPMIKG